MPTSITLAESAKLTEDKLLRGVIENVITVNRSFEALPFVGVEGTGHTYTRENALGDAMVAGVGTEITAKNPATYTKITVPITTLAAKGTVDNLIRATRSNVQDQLMEAIRSKAKSVGRLYQNLFINGDSNNANEFDGLLNLVSAGQTVHASTNGDVLSLEKLDSAISLVTAKDGQVDFFLMNDREINAYFSLLRSHGGVGVNDVVTLPSGVQVPQYRGVPIFRNDYIPVNLTQGSASNAAPIFAGCWNEGNDGLAGLTSMQNAGMQVIMGGQAENYNETWFHVIWYASLALHSDKALSMIEGIVPA